MVHNDAMLTPSASFDPADGFPADATLTSQGGSCSKHLASSYARISRSGPVPASNFAAILTGLGGVEVEEFDDAGSMAGGEAFLLFGFFG
jgi:hypothetical protein